MIIDLPFYENDADGNRCAQVCAKIVLEHFLGMDYSLDELDELMKRKIGKATYTTQVVGVLYDLGLDLKYYSGSELEPFLEGEEYIRRHYGKDAEKILRFSDVPVAVESIRKVLDKGIFENKKLSLEEIMGFIEMGAVPIVLIDYNKIIGRDDFYQGHTIVVTGFDDENIYFHQSGPSSPTPNMKVRKDVFVEAMDANGTDNDCVVVFGKRDG